MTVSARRFGPVLLGAAAAAGTLLAIWTHTQLRAGPTERPWSLWRWYLPLATVTGLVHAVFVPDIVDGLIERPSSTGERRGYLGQMGQWLRESFWDEERPGGQGSS